MSYILVAHAFHGKAGAIVGLLDILRGVISVVVATVCLRL